MYKWKNHFPEMKGDVGMSSHEKEGEQENAHPKTDSHPTQWVINEFLFWGRHPLDPFLFHVVTSLHPLQLRESFFHLFHSFFSLGKSPNKKVIVLCTGRAT